MPLKVGITGGIGSGKSTIAKIFSVLGVPVYYADDAARWIMNTDTTVKAAIKEHFGEEVYENGILVRAVLSAKVFGNDEKLKILNGIVHPATIQYGKEWMEKQTFPYAIKEAAIFFESGSAAQLDFIIGVFSPSHLRIQRVMKRDGIKREQVIQRMDKQIPESLKMKLCDAVITNTQQEMVIPQVLALHEKLMAMAAKNPLLTENA